MIDTSKTRQKTGDKIWGARCSGIAIDFSGNARVNVNVLYF